MSVCLVCLSKLIAHVLVQNVVVGPIPPDSTDPLSLWLQFKFWLNAYVVTPVKQNHFVFLF